VDDPARYRRHPSYFRDPDTGFYPVLENFTTGQIARVFNVSRGTIGNWFDSGDIGGFRFASRHRRITRVALARFVSDQPALRAMAEAAFGRGWESSAPCEWSDRPGRKPRPAPSPEEIRVACREIRVRNHPGVVFEEG
jgi:excisionase family DNA binding protein